MSSAKKKQDEKNLKLLREIAAQTPNRICFDCNQKGPTYINMSIGSFVCTSCSGILRGLTPPHRVKSITMASFTSEEIDQLRHKGNQYCRAVWMGLWRDDKAFSPGTDESKLRDLMIDKYEKKSYYIDPIVAAKNLSEQQTMSNSSSSGSITPSSSSSGVGLNAATVTSQTTSSSIPRATASSTSLTPLPRTQPQQSALVTTATSSTTPQVSSFANFDTANIFVNTTSPVMPTKGASVPSTTSSTSSTRPPTAVSGAVLQPLNTSSGASQGVSQTAASYGNVASTTSEDRYAALKSLDEEFKTHKEQPHVEQSMAGLNLNGSSSSSSAVPPVATSPPDFFAASPFVTGSSAGVFPSNGASPFASSANGGFGVSPTATNGAFGVTAPSNGAYGAPVSTNGAFGVAPIASNGGAFSHANGAGVFGTPPSFSVPNNAAGGIVGATFGGAPAIFGAPAGGAWGNLGPSVAVPQSTAAVPANPFTAGVCGPPPPANSNYNPFTAGSTDNFNNNKNNHFNNSAMSNASKTPVSGKDTLDSGNNWANFSTFNSSPSSNNNNNPPTKTEDNTNNWANFNNSHVITNQKPLNNTAVSTGAPNWANFSSSTNFAADNNKTADPWNSAPEGSFNTASSATTAGASFNPFL